MSARKQWSAVLWAFLLAAATVIWFVGPPSPAGRYEVTVPMVGAVTGLTKKAHVYLKFAEGRVAMNSNFKLRDGTNILDFGTYERSTSGWTSNLGPQDETVVAFKIESSWLGMKCSNSNATLQLRRCFHYWD